MSTLDIFTAIQHSALSSSISRFDHLVGAVAQLAHITGLILLLSSLVLVNLRLLGLGLTDQPVSKLATATHKFIWIGLGLLAISGLFIFIPAALIYYVNPFFWYKAEFLILAITVQLTLFHWATTTENVKPILSKAVGLLSLTLWFGVGASGRIIGFLN
jgi:hypothetical protein